MLDQQLPNVYLFNDERYQQKRKRSISAEKSDKIIEQAKKHVEAWFSYFSHNITSFRNDKYFFNDEQWNNQEWSSYVQTGKTPYTFNKLKPLVRQLLGEQMNMQPKLNLVPTNPESANANNDLMLSKFLRALAYGSHASQAYSECFKNQCVGGWGVLKVGTEYEDPYKFDQKITIKGSPDPLTVGFDPNAQKSCKTDGDFQFCYEIISKEDFEASYPNAKVPTGQQILGSSRSFLPQIDRKSVVVLEYYVKDYKSKTLVQLTNGVDFKQDVLEEDAEEVAAQYEQMMAMRGVPLEMIPPLVEANRRKTKLTFIKCYKLTSEQVLEEYEWPASSFPFVFVDAMSYIQEGKQYTESFIHGAKDAQKNYNYCMSEAINGLSRLRKEQVYGTEENFKNYEEIMRNPDRQQGFVPFNVDPENPQPIFRPPEELPQAFFQLAESAEEDIYKTLGVYPAARGELPNQTSGVAIGRTITQGNLSFVQLMQNLYTGMQAVGEIVMELIPKLYDTERIVSVVDESGKSQSVTINQVQGNQVKNDVTDSVYKLEVQPVASFTIQQELVREELYRLASIYPAVSPLVLDMIASTIQSPIAPRLVDRFETLVPQNILREEKGLPPLPPQPNPQQELMQAQMAKVQSETAKNMASAQKDKAEVTLKAQKLQQDAVQNQQKNQLDAAHLQVERQKLADAIEKAYIDADAEITNAHMQKDMTAMKVLSDLHKAEMKHK